VLFVNVERQEGIKLFFQLWISFGTPLVRVWFLGLGTHKNVVPVVVFAFKTGVDGD
jgi:hypothetical protein